MDGNILYDTRQELFKYGLSQENDNMPVTAATNNDSVFAMLISMSLNLLNSLPRI
jgi:hypothetical protein